MDIAGNIATLRAALSMSQVDLAIELDASPASVSAWERGKAKPRRTAIARMKDLAHSIARPDLFSANGVLRTAAVAGNEPCEPARHELSLRDQFAMAALTGITTARSSAAWTSQTASFIAIDAYAVADAMLRERGKKEAAA